MKEQIKRETGKRRDLQDAEGWMRILGRVGITAMGIVYLAVGALALQVAFGVGGELTDARGALAEIGQQPFGQTMLYVIGLGLIAYAVYRVLGAWRDIDAKGSDSKGIMGRVAFAFTGLIYGALGASILGVNMASGGGSNAGASGQGGRQEMTAELMSQPFGRWLVGLVGLVIIGYAVYQGVKAWQRKFLHKFKTSQMRPKTLDHVSKAGLWGLIARAVVLAVTGGFFINAALSYNPNEAGGLAQSLAAIARQPFGTFLLAAVAAGLIMYAIYAFYLAKYRHFSRGVA